MLGQIHAALGGVVDVLATNDTFYEHVVEGNFLLELLFHPLRTIGEWFSALADTIAFLPLFLLFLLLLPILIPLVFDKKK